MKSEPKEKKNKYKIPAWEKKTSEEKLEVFASMMEKSILSYPNLMRRSFVAGIFTGLGATIGVVLVFSVVVWFLSLLGGIPFLGDWLHINEITTQVQNLNPKK